MVMWWGGVELGIMVRDFSCPGLVWPPPFCPTTQHSPSLSRKICDVGVCVCVCDSRPSSPQSYMRRGLAEAPCWSMKRGETPAPTSAYESHRNRLAIIVWGWTRHRNKKRDCSPISKNKLNHNQKEHKANHNFNSQKNKKPPQGRVLKDF